MQRRENEKMDRTLNRTAYTKRIMDIVASIRKQREEIDRILNDTKSVQREINSFSGKLDRTFQATDELIYKDASRNEASRRAYKLMVALHEVWKKFS